MPITATITTTTPSAVETLHAVDLDLSSYDSMQYSWSHNLFPEKFKFTTSPTWIDYAYARWPTYYPTYAVVGNSWLPYPYSGYTSQIRKYSSISISIGVDSYTATANSDFIRFNPNRLQWAQAAPEYNGFNTVRDNPAQHKMFSLPSNITTLMDSILGYSNVYWDAFGDLLYLDTGYGWDLSGDLLSSDNSLHVAGRTSTTSTQKAKMNGSVRRMCVLPGTYPSYSGLTPIIYDPISGIRYNRPLATQIGDPSWPTFYLTTLHDLCRCGGIFVVAAGASPPTPNVTYLWADVRGYSLGSSTSALSVSYYGTYTDIFLVDHDIYLADLQTPSIPTPPDDARWFKRDSPPPGASEWWDDISSLAALGTCLGFAKSGIDGVFVPGAVAL